MLVAQPTVKLYARTGKPQPTQCIELFHRWIQQRRLDDVLLLDVADYSHVHGGPGVLLVAHEAYYGIESSDGRLGLQYRRRRGGALDPQQAWRAALAATLTACQHLEADFDGELHFAANEVLLGFDDRLNAPQGDATHEALASALEALGGTLYGAPPTVEPGEDPRSCFRARLRSDHPVELADLLSRLG
jgi:hypothetical protein